MVCNYNRMEDANTGRDETKTQTDATLRNTMRAAGKLKAIRLTHCKPGSSANLLYGT